MRRIFLTVILLAFATQTNAADNWPQFRGPHGDGHADARNLPTIWSEKENIRWKTAIHGKGWSSPVVWGDQIWLTTAKETYAANAPKENSPQKVPRPELLELFAVCIDKKTGAIVHDIPLRQQKDADYCHSRNSYATPTPVIEDGRLYAHFGSHGTFCVDTKTGKPLWERLDLKCDHFRGPASSPIVHGDLLFLTFDGFDVQYVTALNKSDGKTAWKKDRNIKYRTTDHDRYKAYSTPSVLNVEGKDQLISPSAEATIAYDPKTGDEIWRVHHDGMNQACKPVFGHGLIFLSTGHMSRVLAIPQGEKGMIPQEKIAWTSIKAGPTRPSFLLVGDLIYWVSDNGFISCSDAKTGTQHWQERLVGSEFSSSPIYADGRIYICDEVNGKTHVVATGTKFESIAVNKLDAGCMASPAAVGDALFVRTKTHLYCIGKK